VNVQNHLAEMRRARGYSAAELAAKAGLTRQTIYAIEAGSYVPNTTASLRLARVLGSTVEELFHLEDQPGASAQTPAQTMELDLLAEDDDPQDGQPVQLARVGTRAVGVARSPLTWQFPAADAFLLSSGKREKRARVQLFRGREPLKNRLVVAGCDPGMSVLARHVEKAGVELVPVHANSSKALQLLKAGLIHIAGSHLRDEATGESNLVSVRKLFPRGGVAVFTFAVWEEGFVVAKRNPKSIRDIADLTREGVRMINREPGAGSRALLDSGLRHLGIRRDSVRGYQTIARGHLPAAWQVRLGNADCCIATRGAARVLGLDFIPLVSERYDLVLRKQHLSLPAVQVLLDTLNRNALRRELESLGGYDTATAGKQVA
jgi:putative molybdopterin biosynthesis protein